MNTVLPIVSAIILLLGLAPTAQARDGDDRPGQTRRELRELSAEITGGASLLAGIASSRPTKAFHDRARQFSDAVGRREQLGNNWRQVNSSFETARKSVARGNDPRIAFLVSHLQEDLAAAAPLVGSYAGRPGSPSAGTVGANGRISFIDQEICVGTARSDRACPTPRDSLTFRIPRDVAVINRLDGEWRDFGRKSNAEIYVNDRLVWRVDVNKDWDGDGTALNVRVTPGSTVTIRSSTGDPIWIRRLTAETLAVASADQTYKNPWDYPWRERN